MQQPATFSLPHLHKMADLPWERLHARAGVPPSTTYSTAAFFRLWEAAETEFADPAAGLRLGRNGISQGYGVAALVALHAPDLCTALKAVARYKRLTCPELIEIDDGGDYVIVRYRWLLATTTVPRLLVDMVLASLAEMVREGTAGRVTPVRVELARHPRHADVLRQHFTCPIVFNAAEDAMLFDRAARDVPFVTANGGAFARITGGLEQWLRACDGPDALIADVRVAIARQLSAGIKADVAAIAARLALSSRTLQRRLDERRTSFGEQLAEVRRLTARRLLTATNFDAVAIALLLGFNEPNSFARAFRRWENTSPARWRERQAAFATKDV